MGKNGNKIGGKGRCSGGGASYHGGDWSNIVLNGSLRVRTSRNLRKNMGDKLPTLALMFDRRNILLNGQRSRSIFFRLVLKFNHLTSRAYRGILKLCFHLGHEFMKPIQIPTIGHQMHVWKLCNLHGRIDTEIGVDIDPIQEKNRQTQKKQNILHNEFTMNEPEK